MIKLMKSVILFCVLVSCIDTQPMPVELAFGLKSYSSIETIESIIMMAGANWAMVEENQLDASDPRPSYAYEQFETRAFSDGENPGKTYLSFYNGKRMSV